MDERIMFGLYQSCGNRGSVGRVFWLQWCGWRMCVGGLGQGLEGWGGVMSVKCANTVALDMSKTNIH